MDNKQITGKQMQAVIIMFLLGSSLVVGTASEAKQDSWICILIASIMVLPMILMYCRILAKYPGCNFFDIILKVFGKIAGKIICCLYVWYALHLGSLVLRNFSEFMHVQALRETPSIIILSFTILICIWTVNSGVKSIGRISKFTFPFLAGSIFLAVLLGFKILDFSNIQPVMSTNTITLLDSSFTMFTFPFAELIVTLPLFSCVIPKDKPKKIFMKGLYIALIFLLISNIANLLALGMPNVKMFYFPSYLAVSLVSVGEFFTRFEVLIAANLLLAGYIKICVCLYSSSMGFAKLCNQEKYKAMAAPCGLIMITVATLMYNNTEEMFKWLDIYKIYAIPFQLILPVIIWIAIEIKTRINKTSNTQEPQDMKSSE